MAKDCAGKDISVGSVVSVDGKPGTFKVTAISGNNLSLECLKTQAASTELAASCTKIS